MRKLTVLIGILVLFLICFSQVFAFAVLVEDTNEVEVKTGLAVNTSIFRSEDAGEEDGLAQIDSDIVAVTVDSSGKITNCSIDSAQTRINFSKEGRIITPLDKEFVGKQEMGEEYGMIQASSIQKAWYQQANSLADYVVDKTIEEVKGISLNEEGAPTNAELTSSVTMHISNYIEGIEKAVSNASYKGASADDMLGIGVITTIDRSEDATGEEEGIAEAYSTYAVVTVDEQGIITSCIIDASQGSVTFNNNGHITSDLSVLIKTKNEIGDDYGMIVASSIGKEWHEQADSFARYVVGKTIDEIKGISLNEEGVPVESELTSSVTIHAGPFLTVIEKAYNTAR